MYMYTFKYFQIVKLAALLQTAVNQGKTIFPLVSVVSFRGFGF